MALLSLAQMMSQFDRIVINLMVEPIKAEFALSDAAFGALQGFAFGIFYTLMSFPIGRMADRYQRRIIIGGGLALFSLFAAGSGLARSYGQLFAARVGVGVGEASLTPAGLSLISDSFPPEKIGRPVSVFLMCSFVGSGLAFIIGGKLLEWLGGSGLLRSGPLAGFEPWQAAFVIIAAPGLLLAPLFLLLREPVRRGAGAPLSLREAGRVILDRVPALGPMFAGFSMVAVVSYAFAIWTPALFIRVYGWTPAEVGLWFGLVMLVFGTGGSFAAGWLSDRLAATGMLDAPLKVAAWGFVGCGLFGGLAPLMPRPELALAMLAPAIFLSTMPYPCAGAAIQLVVPNRARAQVTAIYITIITLVGLGVAPVVIGLMTDRLFDGPKDVRYSLAIVVAAAAPIMCVLVLAACRPYRALRAAS